jgi:hypothetical protein
LLTKTSAGLKASPNEALYYISNRIADSTVSYLDIGRIIFVPPSEIVTAERGREGKYKIECWVLGL